MLGFAPSEKLCRHVVKVCEEAGDVQALQRAWVYARARAKRTPTAGLAVWVANALRGLGRPDAAQGVLERHTMAGGRLSPLGQRVLDAVRQQAA